jgi:hypothetical protein
MLDHPYLRTKPRQAQAADEAKVGLESLTASTQPHHTRLDTKLCNTQQPLAIPPPLLFFFICQRRKAEFFMGVREISSFCLIGSYVRGQAGERRFLDLSLFLLLFGKASRPNTRESAPPASKFLGRRLIDRGSL